MECPICYNIILKSYTTDCLHHFCQSCIFRWCKHDCSCPQCRSFIYFLKPDPEFDFLTSQALINNPSTDLTFTKSNYLSLSESFNIDDSSSKLSLFYIDCSSAKSNLGITVSNNNGIGVEITYIQSNSLASQAGLKKNFIILFINDIPCFNHKQVIGLMEHFKYAKSKIILKVLCNHKKFIIF